MTQQRSTLARLNPSIRDDGNGSEPFSIKGSSPYTMYTDKGNVVDAGAGDDWVSAGTLGADTIEGRGGNDALSGGDGVDFIDGGTRDDMLLGGAGADTIMGGAGEDYIVGSGAFGLRDRDHDSRPKDRDQTGTSVLLRSVGRLGQLVAWKCAKTQMKQQCLIGVRSRHHMGTGSSAAQATPTVFIQGASA